jgi:flagellar motor switch protein FliM
LRHAWENVIDLKLEVVQVESNPQLVQIVPPNEVVVLISFELTIGDLRGMINLCIPYNSIERIGGKLSANSWVSYGKRQATPESIQQISRKVYTSLVDVHVRLAQTAINTGELIGLKVGDIITTEKDVHHPLVVSVEGIPKFFANAGAYKGRKAIVIHDTIKNPSEALGE